MALWAVLYRLAAAAPLPPPIPSPLPSGLWVIDPVPGTASSASRIPWGVAFPSCFPWGVAYAMHFAGPAMCGARPIEAAVLLTYHGRQIVLWGAWVMVLSQRLQQRAVCQGLCADCWSCLCPFL